MSYQIAYYSERVFKDIRKLPKKLLARYVVLTERMERRGPSLGMPYTRAMGDGLFELRVKAEEGIARAFYAVRIGEEILILHSFVKKTQETPKKELNIARKRLNEVTKDEK